MSATGAELKAAGQQLALDLAGDWLGRVLVELADWIAEERGRGMKTMTMEAFRATAQNLPPSHKAWGGMTSAAVKVGLIVPATDAAGEPIYRRAVSPRTHAHPVRLWRFP